MVRTIVGFAAVVVTLAACGRIEFDDVGRLPVTVGPVFRFQLDETSGHVVHDSSGAGRDGYVSSLTDVTWMPSGGKVGGAAHFDGVPYESFVKFPATAMTCPYTELAGSLTVGAWVQFDSFHAWNGFTLGDVAVMQGTAGGMGGGWGLGATTGCGGELIGFELAAPAPAVKYAVRCGTTTLATGTWYFLTGVYDATARTSTVYLDGLDDSGGAPSNSVAVPSATNQPDACPFLGSSRNQSKPMVGLLDEVWIFDRALSPGEVMQLFVDAGG